MGGICGLHLVQASDLRGSSAGEKDTSNESRALAGAARGIFMRFLTLKIYSQGCFLNLALNG